MTFQVPQFGADFVDRVVKRVECLIMLNLWDIPKDRFEGWLRQFHTEEEQFFAACVLDSLIYRSKAQFIASAEALFRGQLSLVLRHLLRSDSDFALVEALRGATDPGIRLVPVIKAKDPPTKSGPLVLRKIQKRLELFDRWTIWPWDVNNAIQSQNVKAIIFVDDFLGSGDQFSQFLHSQKLPFVHPGVHWIYAPVIASREGLDLLRSVQPTVKLVTAEVLEDTHKFFCAANWKLLTSGAIADADAKAFYLELLKRKGLNFSTFEFGYSDMELCIGLEHSSPDNSLPILWYKGPNWTSLFDPRQL